MSAIQAIRLHAFGGPENLRLEEIEAPVPGPGQVLVRVAAASVNPLDWKIREGQTRAFMSFELPVVLGCDMAGTVDAVGLAWRSSNSATRFMRWSGGSGPTPKR